MSDYRFSTLLNLRFDLDNKVIRRMTINTVLQLTLRIDLDNIVIRRMTLNTVLQLNLYKSMIPLQSRVSINLWCGVHCRYI